MKAKRQTLTYAPTQPSARLQPRKVERQQLQEQAREAAAAHRARDGEVARLTAALEARTGALAERDARVAALEEELGAKRRMGNAQARTHPKIGASPRFQYELEGR